MRAPQDVRTKGIIMIITITIIAIIIIINIIISYTDTTRKSASHMMILLGLGTRGVTRYGFLCAPPTIATDGAGLGRWRVLPRAGGYLDIPSRLSAWF